MRFSRRVLGLFAAGLLLAIESRGNVDLSPRALSFLSSGELVMLVSTFGVFRYTPSSGQVVRLVDGFGLYEAVDLQVAIIGGTESIFVTQVSRSGGRARLVRFGLDGRKNGEWYLPFGKTRCSGLAIDAQVPVAYVVSVQTAEILQFDLRKPETAAKPLTKVSQAALGPIVFDGKRRRLLVADVALGGLYAVDLASGKSTRLAKGLGEPSAMILDPKTDELFITDPSGRRVWSLELTSQDAKPKVLVRAGDLEEPVGLALARNGDLWIGDVDKERLFRISRQGDVLGKSKKLKM